jgi:hypothetical protein
MEILRDFKKRKAIRRYVRDLPRLLVRHYGFSPFYTPAQVKKTIERSGLNKDYSCYALSMFTSPQDFARYHDNIGETCDYSRMRSEIATSHFHGNAQFSITDMRTHWVGDDANSSGHSAGFGHGGGHGHGGHGG